MNLGERYSEREWNLRGLAVSIFTQVVLHFLPIYGAIHTGKLPKFKRESKRWQQIDKFRIHFVSGSCSLCHVNIFANTETLDKCSQYAF